MVKKIEKLTKEQESLFPAYVQKWLDIGLSTKRIDREECNKAIDAFYESIKFDKPKFKIYVKSPLEACIAGEILKNMFENTQVGNQVRNQVESQVRNQVESQVWSQVRSQVGNQVRNQVESQVRSQVESQVESQVWSQVRSQVGNQVRNQVRSQVESQVRNQVRNQVESQVGNQVESQVRSQVRSQVGNQVRNQVESQVRSQVRSQVGNLMYIGFWSGYYSFYDFFAELVDVSLMYPCMELSKHCSCINAYKDYVIIAERPTKIVFDENKRLHSEVGAAIEFENGEKYYSWHGTSIPEEWIENKKSLLPEDALKIVNMDQRKAACEILGWNNILKKLKSKIIDKNKDPQIGVLIECEIPGVGKEKFLRVTCGTGREFSLIVPPTMKTALEANAWTFNLTADEYKPEVRT